MKDILIIGVVGLALALVHSGGELIIVVLFALLVVAAAARTLRSLDLVVICGVGLIWEAIVTDSRNWINIALFGFLPARLLLDTLAKHQTTATSAFNPVPWSVLSPRRVREWLLNGFGRLGARITTRGFAFELVAALGVLCLGIGVAAYFMLVLGVSRAVIGYGALSYALGAVGFKGLAYTGLIVPVLHKHLTPIWVAIAQGLVSALSELGAATLFFLFVTPVLSIPELLGFGAAAGIIEALVIAVISIVDINILGGTPVEHNGAVRWQDLGASPVAVTVFPVIERGLTMVLHTSSRALIYAAIALRSVLPALLAVSVFATVDALAYYALLKKWNVLSFTVALRFYALVASGAGILTLVFWRLHGAL